jgi:hypothetical protein
MHGLGLELLAIHPCTHISKSCQEIKNETKDYEYGHWRWGNISVDDYLDITCHDINNPWF